MTDGDLRPAADPVPEEIEAVARAITRSRGIDPDSNLLYGEKPAWEYVVDDARAAIVAYEAVLAW